MALSPWHMAPWKQSAKPTTVSEQAHVNHQHLHSESFACVATETSFPEHRPQAHRGVPELAAKLDTTNIAFQTTDAKTLLQPK